MTTHSSALAASSDERPYYIRQALQLLEGLDECPQLTAVRENLEHALNAESDADAIGYLRPAVGMLVEYRHTGDVVHADHLETGVDMVTQSVEVELPAQYAAFIAVRLKQARARGRPIDPGTVEDMARDYGVAIEEFTVAPDGMPLVEWLEAEAGFEIESETPGDCEVEP